MITDFQEFILRYYYALRSPALSGQSAMAFAHGMKFQGPFFPQITKELSQLLGLPFPLPDPVYAKSKTWYLKLKQDQVTREKVVKRGGGMRESYTTTTTEWCYHHREYKDLVPGEDEWLEGEDAHDKIKAMPPEEREHWTWMNPVPPTKDQEEEAFQAWKRSVLERGSTLPEPLPPIPEHG